jgi:hypothetical protein
MTPVETIPGMSGGRTKENNRGMNSTSIYSKNFKKYHNVP